MNKLKKNKVLVFVRGEMKKIFMVDEMIAGRIKGGARKYKKKFLENSNNWTKQKWRVFYTEQRDDSKISQTRK